MQQISGQRKKKSSGGKPRSDRPVVTSSVAVAAADVAAAPAAPQLPTPAGSCVTAPASTPVGMPAPPASAVPQPPAAPASPPGPEFSAQRLVQLLRQPASSEPEPPYSVPVEPPPKEAPIPLMEPELVAASTVPFAALSSANGQVHLKHVLDTAGFAVVSGVMDSSGIAAAERLWADDLRSLLVPERCRDEAALNALAEDPVHRWPMDRLPLGTKFASDFGLPHGRAAWHCRAHPAVRAVFASIFGTDALCCGMDNVFFNNQPATAGANATAASRLWPHADQNSAVKPSGKYECYQGVLYLWPADGDTSATVVWPRSHTAVYPGLMQGGKFRRHFCMLPSKQHTDFVRNARRVVVPAGGLLLWNSRTIHQGFSGGARLAFPICYEPVSRRDHKALASKQRVIAEGTPTSHWASLGEPHPVASSDNGVLEGAGVAIAHRAHHHCLNPDGSVKKAILELC